MQTPWGELPVSDAHVHFFSRNFFIRLAGEARLGFSEVGPRLGWDIPPEDPAGFARQWAAELDLHGVASAALIASIPGDEASVLAAACACPGRFYAYAMINPAAPHTKIAEGLRAICLFPAMHGYRLEDERAEAVIAEAASRRLAVFVHCGVLTVGVRQKLGLPSPFDMRCSHPLDLHRLALRYPQARFIVPHFGAGYLREALMLADLCPNVYLDTSSSNSWMRYEGLDLQTVFRRALDVAGAGRLLFGTDSSFFPRGWNRAVFDSQVKALEGLGLAPPEARLIFGENLRQLFS